MGLEGEKKHWYIEVNDYVLSPVFIRFLPQKKKKSNQINQITGGGGVVAVIIVHRSQFQFVTKGETAVAAAPSEVFGYF